MAGIEPVGDEPDVGIRLRAIVSEVDPVGKQNTEERDESEDKSAGGDCAEDGPPRLRYGLPAGGLVPAAGHRHHVRAGIEYCYKRRWTRGEFELIVIQRAGRASR